MLEDRMRGLKMRLPLEGVRIKLIPSLDELEQCRRYGQDAGEHLMGVNAPRILEMADLLASRKQIAN
jgi:hypothetical protein